MQDNDGQAEVIERRERLKSLVAVLAFSRMLHKAVDCFDGDLDACAILMAVGCASTSAVLREPRLLRDLDSPDPVPDVFHRPVSRRAIAASTGLPRETVRRKIAQLVEQGLLVEEREGVRTPSGVLSKGRLFEFTSMLVRETTRASLELARLDQMAEVERRMSAPRVGNL